MSMFCSFDNKNRDFCHQIWKKLKVIMKFIFHHKKHTIEKLISPYKYNNKGTLLFFSHIRQGKYVHLYHVKQNKQSN